METISITNEEYLMLKSICTRYEESMKLNEKFNVKIIDYPFSFRAKSVLVEFMKVNTDVITLMDLKNKLKEIGSSELLRYRNCGKKTLIEVREELNIGF